MTRNDGRISIKEITEEQRASLYKQKGVGWAPNNVTMGGYMADIPEPRLALSSIRGARRLVRVTVIQWARHYHVGIDEVSEHYWHPVMKRWNRPWDDEVGKGKSFSTRCTYEHHVTPYIERTFKEHFPRITHYMDLDHRAKRMWVYSRTGD